LNAPSGEPTNAVFGFINMLDGLIEDLNPTRICVVWDGGLSADRQGLLPEYKQNRPEMPDSLRVQLDEIVKYLSANGIESYCQDGVEADDYIGCLALKAAEAGWCVVIATSDKDFMQLVSNRVFIANPAAKDGTLMGEEEVGAKIGVRPGQVVDWLSMVGDSADNIPGVPGVGAKTATELLVAFGSIDAIFSRVAEVKSVRVREALLQSRERVEKNRRLIGLKTDLECNFSSARFSRHTRDFQTLRGLYTQWGFNRMLAKLAPEKDQTTQEFAF
jgi:DNA polymerase-1